MSGPCEQHPACGGPIFCADCEAAFIDEAAEVFEDMWMNPPPPVAGGLGDFVTVPKWVGDLIEEVIEEGARPPCVTPENALALSATVTDKRDDPS